jgi:hypothetical protein
MFETWSITGSTAGGPAGFDTVAQRTLLVVTGALILAGALGTLALVRNRVDWRTLTFSWIGGAVAVTCGPAQIALSNHGTVGLPLLFVCVATTLAGLGLAGSALRTAWRTP